MTRDVGTQAVQVSLERAGRSTHVAGVGMHAADI